MAESQQIAKPEPGTKSGEDAGAIANAIVHEVLKALAPMFRFFDQTLVVQAGMLRAGFAMPTNPTNAKPGQLSVGASEAATLAGMHRWNTEPADRWKVYLTVGLRGRDTRATFKAAINFILESIDEGVRDIGATVAAKDRSQQLETSKVGEGLQRTTEFTSLVANITAETAARSAAAAAAPDDDDQRTAGEAIGKLLAQIPTAEPESGQASTTILTAEQTEAREKAQRLLGESSGEVARYAALVSKTCQLSASRQQSSANYMEAARRAGANARSVGIAVEGVLAAANTLARNNSRCYSRAFDDRVLYFAYVDGWTAEDEPIELKTRKNRLFDNVPKYEKIQCAVAAFATKKSRVLWRQVFIATNGEIQQNERWISAQMVQNAIGMPNKPGDAARAIAEFDNAFRTLAGHHDPALLAGGLRDAMSDFDAAAVAQYALEKARDRGWVD